MEVDVKGRFFHNGTEQIVRGFYAGEDTYIRQILSGEAGSYTYQIEGVAGAVSEEACIECKPAAKNRHGMVRPYETHFRYADGTWFYPFGTTVYAFSHQEDERVAETFETLAEAPFNKIRMCVFPKHYDYNHNEPPYYAFEKQRENGMFISRAWRFGIAWNPDIRKLDEMGIQCDLILFHPYDNWGFSKLSREEALVYLDYVTRRLGAFPNVWWSLANEYGSDGLRDGRLGVLRAVLT